jgi:ribosomal-protein-alanine N-acetyltransferase
VTAPLRLEIATTAHVAVLAALHARCFSDPWTPRSVAEVMATPGAFARFAVVAASPDAPVGFVLARVAAEEAELLTLCVLPEHRRHGIATALLDDAMRYAARLGARAMFLEVEETNEAGRMLYAARGFAAVGRRPYYYRRPNSVPVAALVMRVALKS